jgi:TolB protein
MLSGSIAFAAGKLSDYDIFLLDLGSNKLNQLTSGSYWNDYPRFSPDGKRIAFVSNRSGQEEIWLMNRDGSESRSLTASVKWANFPCWSPTGKEIAFVSNEYFQLDIFALDLETGATRRLTTSKGIDMYPDWSPDGQSIAFASERGVNQDIYLLNLQTKEEKRITSHPAPDFSPAFSPDGKQIAFVSSRPDAKNNFRPLSVLWDFFYGDDHLDVWVVEVSAGGLRQITTNKGADRNVRWSPDGKNLVYTNSSAATFETRVMLSDMATGTISPLKIDLTTVNSEVQRDFDVRPFYRLEPFHKNPGLFDHLTPVEKREYQMTRAVATFIPGFVDKIEERIGKRELDRVYHATERYIDWK